MGFVAPVAGLLGAGGLSTAIGLVGTGLSAIGSVRQGEAEANYANYEAQVARNNAVTAQQNANYSVAAGETKAYDTALAERYQLGAITAGIAGKGIDVNTGSAADVRTSEAAKGLTDVERVRQNAQLQAYGYRTQSTNYTAEAGLDTAQAQYALDAGYLKGFSGLLSGFSKFGGFGTGGGSGGGSNVLPGTITGDFVGGSGVPLTNV